MLAGAFVVLEEEKNGLGIALLAILTLLIVLLLVRTAIAVARREICVEGH